ncbi:MAG: ABC transporter permease [Candidatus Promineifilaceae bacterium]
MAAMTSVPMRRRIRSAFNQNVLTWLSVGMFIFLYLPILVLIIYSFNEGRFVSNWTGFSTHWYGEVLRDEQVINALRFSIWLAFWSMIISTVIGTLTAIVMERFKFWGKVTYDAILYLPIIIPDIVMALSTLLFFIILGVGLSRYTILIAHVAFNIAFVAIVVRARLADMDATLEEAASDLGANPWETFRRVTLPLLMPGVIAGALLAFTLSLDDFVITFFMSGPGTTTLPILVFSKVRFGISPEINAISTMMFVGSTILVILSLLIQRRT